MIVLFLVKLEIQLLGWNRKASQWKLISFHLEAPLRDFQEVSSIIYPQIKRKIKIAQILSLWERFQKKRKSKSFKPETKCRFSGFQLQAEGKISLKKYYESAEEYSLFQLKGYNLKYDGVRKNKFYKQLKP